MAYQHPLQSMAEEQRQLILEGIAELGKPVDIPIIASSFMVSELSAKNHLDALVQAGKLRKVSGRAVRCFYEIPPEKQETLF